MESFAGHFVCMFVRGFCVAGFGFGVVFVCVCLWAFGVFFVLLVFFPPKWLKKTGGRTALQYSSLAAYSEASGPIPNLSTDRN